MSYAASFRMAVRRRAEDGPDRLILPALFVVLVLPLLIFAALLVPPGEVPDEVAHIVRANSLLHGVLIGHRIAVTDSAGRPAQDAVVVANSALIAAGFTFRPGEPKRLTAERLAELRATQWAAGLQPISVPNTAVYMPLFYVPAAFGLGASHLAGLLPHDAILTARVCNLLTYVGIGLLALLLARRAQGVLFVALSLPMTVSLAASCNQDGLLIAALCLAASLWTRAGPGAWWSGIAVLALALAAKPLYVPLAGIAALAAPVRGLRLGVRLAGLLAAALPAVLWSLLAQRLAVVPFLQPTPYMTGPLWPDTPALFAAWDPALQLQVIRHDPLRLLSLPVASLREAYPVLGLGIVGVLGTLDVLLPDWVYAAWYWAIVAAGLGTMLGRSRDAPGPTLLVSLLALACVAAAAFLVVTGSYLTFTPVGAAEVAGLQGRYALPLLPMLGFALPRLRLPGGGTLRAALLAPCVGMAAAGLIVIPSLLVATYYLR